jgi:hypothetical protein
MPLFVVDCSRHQVERADPLDLARAQAAGMNVVNIQLDRGRQEDVLPTWARTYAARARQLGMGISTYRWLDSRMSGRDSARRAFDRILSLGGPDGMAHVVDCEDNASEQTLRDYVTTITALLGRPIAIYSGKWWLDPRGWRVNDLSPFLWAAPSAGYLGGYPGDSSPHWTVSYGGHATLAVMQYAVTPLPFTGPCSLSAIRDPAVWAALTGGVMTYPDPALVIARTYLMGRGIPGNSLGIVGDTSHQASGGYHVGNDVLARIGKLDSDYSKRQTDKDRPGSNAAMALDIGGLTGPQLAALTAWLIAQCRAGTPDTRNIREVIGRRSAAGGVILYDALGIRAADAGTPDHATHTHLSYYRDSEGGDKTSLFRRYFEPAPQKEDDDMQPVLIKLAGEDTVRLVTMGVGHIPVLDPADLKRWQKFMTDNGMGATVFAWAAEQRPQCGPDLTATPTLTVTPEVATAIAQQIIAAGSNDLSDEDLEEIKALVVAGAKQAAREGTE